MVYGGVDVCAEFGRPMKGRWSVVNVGGVVNICVEEMGNGVDGTMFENGTFGL